MADKKTIAAMSVRIGADVRQFMAEMRKTNTTVKRLSTGFKQVAGLIGVAFSVRAVANFGKESLKAYNIQAQAETKLLTALKGREDAQKRLIKQAQDLQKQTLFGDEETIKAQSLIAAFVKQEDQIKKVIPLVQDLATAKGMDLAGAADLVSKTLGSSTNALSRYGIQVEGAVGSSERLESLMHGLEEAFGGQAEAAAKAGTGGLTQLSNVWGDIKEKAGEALSKGVLPMARGLMDLLSPSEDLVKTNKELIQTNQDQANYLQTLLDQYNTLTVDGIDLTAEQTRELERVSSLLREELGDSIVEIDKETGSYRLNTSAIQDNIQAKMDLASGGYQYLIKTGAEYVKQIKEQEQAVKDYGEEVTRLREEGEQYAFFQKQVNKLGFNTDAMRENARAILANRDAKEADIKAAQILLKYLDALRDKTGERLIKAGAERELGNVKTALLDLGYTIDQIETAFADYNSAVEKLTDSEKEQIDEYKRLVDISRDYNSVLSESEKKALDVARAEENRLKGLNSLESGTVKSIDTQEALNKEIEDTQKALEQIMAFKDMLINIEIDDNGTGDQLSFYEEQIKRLNDLIDTLKLKLAELQGIKLTPVKTPQVSQPGESGYPTPTLGTSSKNITENRTEYTHEDIQWVDVNYSAGLEIFDNVAIALQEVDKYAKALGGTYDSLGEKNAILASGMQDLQSQIQALISDGFSVESEEVQNLIGKLRELEKEYVRINKAAELAMMVSQGINNAIADTIIGITDAVVSGENVLDAVLKSFAKFARQIGEMMVAFGTAMIAIESMNPWLAIPAGIALIAISGLLQKKFTEGPSVPALAEGGVVEGQTTALVGDNPKEPEVGLSQKSLSEVINKSVNEITTSSQVDYFDKPVIKKIGKGSSKENPYIVSPISKLAGLITTQILESQISESFKSFSESESKRIKEIPAFANGGAVFSPTLAMVGDNRNASTDPEIIAPLSKLTSIITSELIKNEVYTKAFSQAISNASKETTNVNISSVDMISQAASFALDESHLERMSNVFNDNSIKAISMSPAIRNANTPPTVKEIDGGGVLTIDLKAGDTKISNEAIWISWNRAEIKRKRSGY